MDEIGYGVVPMSAEDREYRELVGHTGQLLARQAEAVYGWSAESEPGSNRRQNDEVHNAGYLGRIFIRSAVWRSILAPPSDPGDWLADQQRRNMDSAEFSQKHPWEKKQVDFSWWRWF